MKTRNHKILDHPVLGYFLLMFLSLGVSSVISSIIDGGLLGSVIPGYAITSEYMGKQIRTANGVGMAVGALLMAGLFYLWFRPLFAGMLKKKDLLKGLVLLSPILVIHWAGSVVSWTEFGMTGVFLAFLRAFAPGFGEEVAFRGMGVANYLRKVQTEKGVVVIFWLSSVVFGFFHISNAFVGAPFLISVVQSVYAVGIGMALGAVYLRTGNLWPAIIGHMSLDFLEFIRADVGGAGGLMSSMGVGDWITLVAGAAGAVWGLYLIRPAMRSGIVELWKAKWTHQAGPTA